MAGEKKVKGWKDVMDGGLVDPGTSEAYNTGSWRTYRPVWHADRCIHCLQCWSFCPDCSIQVKDEKVQGVDYYHCKGCGICAEVCPVKGEKAITMQLETEALAAEARKK